MSVLQLFRAALQLLADSSAWAKGLAMARQEGGEGALRDTPQPPAMHVVGRHLPTGSEVVGAAGSLDWALCCRASPSGADLAATRAAEAAKDKLAKQLRALDNLALKVVGVQPLLGVARGTAPFPPPPHPLAGPSGASASTAGSHTGGGVIPRCLDPLEVLVTLESSGPYPRES
ncbi:hypothetical protein VOLCADRAFT_97793 [Volvox carteri f. nagariensis]|uniref:Nrap protein domain-containing protein n=1 Tax=Volvox carteri f. nagariensis TaxID=3068 RepID=D8UDN1_VOLCA|nr:uncharacterized protein VOLCADRAFT_97793 [Volvox carteri f. nagariensis]EFJ42224.1 hypothetical protein VOLCADRAFT_97793 [Volvox carteri f. nagariensis]|eukprot:XP_002956767.1 hypothetical protein VOLCADRAFT_97793 [Volvox carteri f. nagariensis]